MFKYIHNTRSLLARANDARDVNVFFALGGEIRPEYLGMLYAKCNKCEASMLMRVMHSGHFVINAPTMRKPAFRTEFGNYFAENLDKAQFRYSPDYQGQIVMRTFDGDFAVKLTDQGWASLLARLKTAREVLPLRKGKNCITHIDYSHKLAEEENYHA